MALVVGFQLGKAAEFLWTFYTAMRCLSKVNAFVQDHHRVVVELLVTDSTRVLYSGGSQFHVESQV